MIDINTFLQSMPILMALVAIVYWTSVARPFITDLTDLANGRRDLLNGTDFTRLFTAVVSVAVSFAFPAATVPLTLLQGATLAAIADGSYTHILKRLFKEEQDIAALLTQSSQNTATPTQQVTINQPTTHLGQIKG